MSRSSRFRGIEEELYELRAGTISFEQFMRAAQPHLLARARYFLRRWPQTLHDEDDLVQELAIEAWRAVDTWDPARCADLVKRVDAQVGRAATRRMRHAQGWPDKRRSPVIRQVAAPEGAFDKQVPPDQEEAVEVGEFVGRLPKRGLLRYAVGLVARERLSIATAARKIAASETMLRSYGMADVQDAERRVAAAVELATEMAERRLGERDER